MYRKDLQELAGISAASIAKLAKGINITTDVLLKICEALNCNIENMIETIEEEEK
ncbi:helix-turn-helix transcriptional regulator [Sneathia sp. DSM 16630]|nr:helix-turn-helix transcriptional regulator [Sneathia sp. DSM 16630]